MKSFAKGLSILLVVFTICCLCACGGEGGQKSGAGFDCRFGESFSLDGETYKIVKVQYDPESDDGDLVGIKIVMLSVSDKAPISFSVSNPDQAKSLLDMVITVGEKDYAETAVSFALNEDKTDEEFKGEAIFHFAVEKGTKITSAAVYKNYGTENEEKVGVDMTAASIMDAEKPKAEIDWMTYHLIQEEIRFKDDETDASVTLPEAGDGEKYVVVKLLGADGQTVAMNDAASSDNTSSILLKDASGKEYEPVKASFWNVDLGGNGLAELLNPDRQVEGFYLYYLVPADAALSDFSLFVSDAS